MMRIAILFCFALASCPLGACGHREIAPDAPTACFTRHGVPCPSTDATVQP